MQQDLADHRWLGDIGRKGIRPNSICLGVIDTDMIHTTMLVREGAGASEAIGKATPIGRIDAEMTARFASRATEVDGCRVD